MRNKRWLISVVVMSCAAALGAPRLAEALATPTLKVDTPFAVPGTNITFSVSGDPGASFSLFMSRTPAEVPLGSIGVLFLQQGALIPLGGGVLDAGGEGERIFSVPAGIPEGQTFYTQVLVRAGAERALSNAVPFKIVDAAPSGRRASRAVAATPDGSRAYVAHLEDGSVSVIDAVNDVKLTELPITPSAADVPHRALDIRIDPEGRHAFVVNAAADRVAVIHTASDSISAQIPVPRGSRRIAFDFSAQRLIYVTNETSNSVLVFEEAPLGRFTQIDSIPLEGQMPGPLLVLSDGRLVVGHRSSHDIEVLDPTAPPGSQTVVRTDTGGLPFDLVLANGEILIPTFVPGSVPGFEGFNRVLRVRVTDFQVLGHLFEDVGTDYVDIDVAGSLLAVVAASSGTVILADSATGNQLDNIELAPSAPTATPQDSVFVPGTDGDPTKLYVVNYFRETVRPILLSLGPPFVLGDEIPLSWSGQPRVPLSGDLTPEEDGDWFFRSVNLFGANALSPNRVSCSTCHIDGASDNLTRRRQAPPGWGLAESAPYGWNGNQQVLSDVIAGAVNRHNSAGTSPPTGADALVLSFMEALQPPASIYLTIDGGLTPAAQAGKTLFEGVAGCSGCHAAPDFIPTPPNPLTIEEGIGTGLAPANVPSLRGAWATAPYLHDGSAQTLLDVLIINPSDVHGMLAAPLTPVQRELLVEYMKTL